MSQDKHDEIDMFVKIIHLGLAAFGIIALLSGDLAEDYKTMSNFGFYFHGWVGICVSFFAGLRFIYGVIGPSPARFTMWVPYKKERFVKVREDIKGLLQFKLPQRSSREGMAAVVEFSGLLIFFYLAMTGILLFFIIEPGKDATGLAHLVKEMHEAGETLLPLFFSLHGGAVIIHALKGDHLWRKMLFLKEK